MKYLNGIESAKRYLWAVALAGLMSLPVLGGVTVAFGQAVQDSIEGTIEVTENADLKALAEITPEQAREAALAEVPGAEFEEGELDEEGGFLVYEVELTEGSEEVDVLVDAGSGEVLLVERESEEEDDEREDEDDGWFGDE